MADVSVPTTPTNPAADVVAIVEDLVERQRQILTVLVATTHPLKNDVQAVLLGLRGVVTKLRNGAAGVTTTAAPSIENAELRDLIADELGRHLPSATTGAEANVHEALYFGLVSVVAPVLEVLRAERDALRAQLDRAVVLPEGWRARVAAAFIPSGDEHSCFDRVASLIESWQTTPTPGPAALARAMQDAENARDRQLPTWDQLSPHSKAGRVVEAGRWLAALRPSASGQTPATPADRLFAALREFLAVDDHARDGLISAYPDLFNGVRAALERAPSSDVPGLNADCTADEAACVHGQTADGPGFACVACAGSDLPHTCSRYRANAAATS